MRVLRHTNDARASARASVSVCLSVVYVCARVSVCPYVGGVCARACVCAAATKHEEVTVNEKVSQNSSLPALTAHVSPHNSPYEKRKRDTEGHSKGTHPRASASQQSVDCEPTAPKENLAESTCFVQRLLHQCTRQRQRDIETNTDTHIERHKEEHRHTYTESYEDTYIVRRMHE